MDLLINASSCDAIMTNDRSGKGMGETAKKEFVKLYIRKYFGREKRIENKYIDKGNKREQDAITLLSDIDNVFYRKNTERLNNEFTTGEPDLYTGPALIGTEEIIDTKNSWDIFTFREANEKDYKWQRVDYMWLTGARRGTTAFCLLNGTVEAILDAKRKASWKYGIDPEMNPSYVDECQLIERNMIFDMGAFLKENPNFDFHSVVSDWTWDIPKEKRIKKFTLERDESDIEALKARIIEGRKFLTTEFGVSTPRTELANV